MGTLLNRTITAQWGGDGRSRVGEVRADTTSPMPDHKGFQLQYRMYSRITRICSTKFSLMNRGVGLYASNSCLTLAKHDRTDGHAVKMRMPRSFHTVKGKNIYIVQLINFYLTFFCCNLNSDSHSTSKNIKNIQLFAETHGNRATPSYLLASV